MPYLHAEKSTKMNQKHSRGPESDNYKMLVGKNLIPEIFRLYFAQEVNKLEKNLKNFGYHSM